VLIQCVLIPPRDALEELATFVGAVRRMGVVEAPQKHRFGRRKADAEPVELVPALNRLALDELALPVTAFGNVTTADANRIVDAITEETRGWNAPTLHFEGGTALDFPGDPSVWAKVDGDVSALAAIAGGVPRSVEHIGFFVDRRVFRPMLAVATVTEATVAPDLNAVVDALNRFRGQDWQIDAVVLKADSFAGSRSEWREFKRIPFG